MPAQPRFDAADLFEQGPVVVFRWRNADGWPVEHVTPNVLDVFGHEADAFVRGIVRYAEVLFEADAARVADEVARAVATGTRTFAHAPYRIVRPDGSTRWLDDFTQVVRDAAGTVTHFVGYVVDVTERVVAEEEARALERRLLQSQKLESLGLMAGGVAHDFNNLLTGILCQASLARKRPGELPPDVRETLAQVESLARRAADLTRQLLAYTGRGSFVVEPVELGAVVRELLPVMRAALPEGARLDLALEPQLPAVLADRAQLPQVVLNLLTNAGEALRGGAGTVRLATSRIEASCDVLRATFGVDLESGRYVVLTVTDSGCGMDESVKSRLFDPFFTTKSAGRGLGMSAVLGIVRAHGGAIAVRSSPGEGSTFTVLLPASDREASRTARGTSPLPPRAAGTVLVIDDEPSVLDAAASVLETQGYRVECAVDGATGLAAFRAHEHDVVAIIIDASIRVLSASETVRLFRRRAPTLPILVTSDLPREQALRDDEADDATSAFLTKPFDARSLERALRDAMQKKSGVPAT